MLLGPHWTHPRSSSTSMPDPATDFAALFSPTAPCSHQSRRAEQPSGLNLHQRIYRPHLYQEPPVLEPLSLSPSSLTRSLSSLVPFPTAHSLLSLPVVSVSLTALCRLAVSLRRLLVSLGSSFAVRSSALRLLYPSLPVSLLRLSPLLRQTPLACVPSLGP